MRRIGYLLVVLSLCLPLAGCGGDEPAGTSTAPADTSASEGSAGGSETKADDSGAAEEAPAE